MVDYSRGFFRLYNIPFYDFYHQSVEFVLPSLLTCYMEIIGTISLLVGFIQIDLDPVV